MSKIITEEELKLINQFTRKKLSKEDVYTFSIILCDNEIDRVNEKFTIFALNALAKLFVGKVGVFEYYVNDLGLHPIARIYSAEVVTDETRKTADGEDYTYIKAHAYIVRIEKNKDFIAEIDASIQKEISIGCCVRDISCSICGKNIKTEGCEHQKGKTYGGKLCCYLLSEPSDAYEWSLQEIKTEVKR